MTQPTTLMHGFIPGPPSLNRRHIDGPVITYSDGQMHWLTGWERLQLLFGKIDAWSLQARHRPDLAFIGKEPLP